MNHRIRTPEGTVIAKNLTRDRAIRAMCTECMGWETHPKECTSTLCPLYPHRGRIGFHLASYTPPCTEG